MAGIDLAAIWDASRDVLHEQVAVIERAVVAGIQGRLTSAGQRAAGREAHKLAGSLGTFGFAEGSRLARALELALTSPDVVDPSEALDLSRLVVDLQAEMARPLEPLPAPGVGGLSASVLVVDADPDRPRRLIEAAAAQGLRATAAATLAAARDAVGGSRPDVVVVDAQVADQPEVDAFLVDLASRVPPVPTVVLVGTAGLAGRVQATRVGGRTVLETPAPPDAIIEAASRLLARERSATVLAVDDDPLFLMIVSELLSMEGVRVETLDDTSALWDTLAAVEPDLLLLDNNMPGVDGLSLCRAIRSDERWARLPVVFLSATVSADVVREMFTAGADDFVAKPVSPGDLVTRVVNRIQRSRVQAEQAGIDPATGLPSARTFVGDAARLLALARQHGRNTVLAVIELEPRREPALAALARLLRQSAEPEDVVGTWSGGRLAVLLYGATGAAAHARISRVLHAARAAAGGEPGKASVGIAAGPDDGADVAALGAAAESALGRARAAAGDAIEIHESPGRGRTELVDVLLVDDDEALGTLVVHALSSRGWTTRWLRDGAQAVELLDDPAFRARAVILDVGLPGLDGLSVLRHLGQTGQLLRTRVVMLTVRTNEGEVLEALDLGAFDHVAKPFSLPVLMHRVRRAVEASG